MHHTWQYDQKMNAVTQNNLRSGQGLKIFVYEDLNIVGQYFFSCKKVVIGQGEDADLHLKDPRLRDIQVIIHIQNDNIIISDRSENTGVYLNGRPIKAAVLDPLDLIEIGKYSLKLRVTDHDTQQDQNYQKVAMNQDRDDNRNHKLNLAELVTPDLHHHRDGFKKVLCCNKNHRSKSVHNPSQPNSKQSKNRHDLSLRDDFFELLPYKGGKKAAEQRTRSAAIAPSKKEKKDRREEDIFELLPHKGSKKAAEQRTRSATITSSQQQKNDRYEEDFFKLPPYPSNKEPFLEEPQFSGPISSPQEKSRRFNLLFSGEFKTGWTLLQVKKNLNRQFGIEYRKLMFLIKGKPTILKRNLTYAKAMKLFKAFESSGAICFIEPIENKSKVPFEKKHKNITGSNNTKKCSGNRKDKKLADLLDQPPRTISNSINVPEKSARRRKNKTTKALLTIRKSGIFSGSKKEAAINHLSSLG